MACRGMLYAITAAEAEKLRSIKNPADRFAHFQEGIEPSYWSPEMENFKLEVDKSWDAVHRILADGTLEWAGGDYPMNHVIFGGEDLSWRETDFPQLLSLKTPTQVRDVAAGLPYVLQEDFYRRYDALPNEYLEMVDLEIDREYSWEYFESIREFWLHTDPTGRFMLFSVDQ